MDSIVTFINGDFLNMDVKISNLAEGCTEFTANVFLCEDNGEVVIIDCGADPAIVKKCPKKIDKIIITHTHWDHVVNLPLLRNYGKPKVYAFDVNETKADVQLKDGDSVVICGKKFMVYHTPGHIPDAICLFNSETGILFSGDTVFPDGGFGRVDLPGGNSEQMLESLRSLVELPIKSMYAGHGDAVLHDAKKHVMQALSNAEGMLGDEDWV